MWWLHGIVWFCNFIVSLRLHLAEENFLVKEVVVSSCFSITRPLFCGIWKINPFFYCEWTGIGTVDEKLINRYQYRLKLGSIKASKNSNRNPEYPQILESDVPGLNLILGGDKYETLRFIINGKIERKRRTTRKENSYNGLTPMG